MIVLDTNVISEYAKQAPSKEMIAWFNGQNAGDLHLCAPVLAELKFGAHIYENKNRSRRYFHLIDQVRERIAMGTFFSFDEKAAVAHARLKALDYMANYTRPHFDAMIAAICIANGATLATRNIRDFEGLDLKLLNPFEAT